MILYLDSSALVKPYTDEAHSRFMRGAAYAAFDAKLIEAARRISLPMLSPD